MGCLNDMPYDHWFGNIHLSGPCNRSCYFCIGQHMMEVDHLNVLEKWPLPGIDKFLAECHRRRVQEVTVTGTNTDPSLYRYLGRLNQLLHEHNFVTKVRTNGIVGLVGKWDQVTVTVCSLEPRLNRKTMGGPPPHIYRVWAADQLAIVLCPEVSVRDIRLTIYRSRARHVQLREPYGQPHQGDPLVGKKWAKPIGELYGNPQYFVDDTIVTYWDVHKTQVSSVNLFANGNVSTSYAVTRGVVPGDKGEVLPQSAFKGGRVRSQWNGVQTVA